MMDATVTLQRTACWCGTPFMVPATLLDQAHNRGHKIYCPHGHMMQWTETQEDKLRRERDRLKQDAARLEDEKRQWQATANAQLERAQKLERATKRLKKRASAGTCPCCQRTFSNMAEHMKHQHPQFVADGGAKVVPLKRA
jgi:septal ring factor EnvC (AmiA/AmiB activator)